MKRSRWLGVFVVAVLVLMLLPIPLLVWMSLFKQAYLVVPPSDGYSLDWYRELPQESALLGSLLMSLGLAFSVAAVSTTVGFLSALGVKYGVRGRLKSIVESFMLLPLVVPTLIISMSLYVLIFNVGRLAGIQIIGSFTMLMFGHVLVTLPWTFRVCYAGVTHLNEDLTKASLSLGHSRAGTFFRVHLPLLKSTIVSSAILAFIVSFADLEMALFLVAPGELTLPVALMQHAATRLDPTLAAMGVTQLVIIAGLLIFANKLFGFGKTFVGGMKE